MVVIGRKQHGIHVNFLQNPHFEQLKLHTHSHLCKKKSLNSFSPEMASQQAIESHRENAEVFYGDALCKEKIQQTLEELELPNGLLPLQDILEVGYNRTTGFVWLKQRKSVKHLFRAIGRTVQYAQEITAFVEKHRFMKATGVTVKELLIWVKIGEIYVEENDPETLSIKTAILGIARSFPISAFQIEEEKTGGGVESQ